MARLPTVSGKKAVRAFERLGYSRERQRGSHVILECEGRPPLAVPEGGGDLKRGLLDALIKASGFTDEEFRGAL